MPTAYKPKDDNNAVALRAYRRLAPTLHTYVTYLGAGCYGYKTGRETYAIASNFAALPDWARAWFIYERNRLTLPSGRPLHAAGRRRVKRDAAYNEAERARGLSTPCSAGTDTPDRRYSANPAANCSAQVRYLQGLTPLQFERYVAAMLAE